MFEADRVKKPTSEPKLRAATFNNIPGIINLERLPLQAQETQAWCKADE